MSEGAFFVGLDLGGTKILSVCVNAGLRVIDQDLRPTEAQEGPAAVIERMVASVRAVAGGREIAGVGVSTPGPCDRKRGIVTTPPNLPGWHDVPLARLIGDRLGVPAFIENDANAAAVAEHRIGAGRGVDQMILVTLGTGVGGGLILDGRLYTGASGAAGEIGHMQLDPQGRQCGCGRRGCFEALAGGRGLEADAEAIIAAEPDGVLARLAREQGATDARVLELAADAGDASAEAAIRKAGRYLGAGLTNIVYVFNPELIVIGGSLRKLGARYLGVATAIVQRESYEQSAADVRIVEAALGDESPAIGAALLAIDRQSGVNAKMPLDAPRGGRP